ncbi:MAG: H+/Cl- antiporter ClcA [Francisellaceae bacterium]|jgi:H+/Cl- antiporter ClcA
MKILGKHIKKRELFAESKKLVSITRMKRRLLFWGGGIIVGLVCVLFAIICDNMNDRFILLVNKYPYLPFIITPVGFMLIVYIMRTMFVGSEGSGIPQVMAALQIKNHRKREKLVSIRIALGKFILTVMGFMCGASIGREGPTIQLSASIMHHLGKIGKFHRDDVERGLLLAGGAAGIAAAFNAPLAGIVFAIEELAGSYEKGVSGTIITTVVLCGFVAMEVLGSYTYFGSSDATLNIMGGGWAILLVVAVIGGLLGGAFSSLLLKISKHMVDVVRKHPLWVAGLLGFAVAVIGFVTHGQTFGSGYDAAKGLLTDTGTVTPLYGFLKMLATLLSYLSGIPGGIFAPSLSAGAGLGSTISQFFSPEYASAIILLSTVAYFSGVVQSPITCFIIVSEMTDTATTSMLLPIMLTSLIATAVSRVVCRESIYDTLSKRYLELFKTRSVVR